MSPGSSTATVSFGQVLSQNGGTLHLEVHAGAGAHFVVGTAQAVSGGTESWGKVTDTPTLVVFEAALTAGVQRKTYRPSFNGAFKVTGSAPGRPPRPGRSPHPTRSTAPTRMGGRKTPAAPAR